MHQWAARAASGAEVDLAGQLQRSLVSLLSNNSHSIVVIDDIQLTPPTLLPVLINLLSERSHFEADGQQYSSAHALVVATLQAPQSVLTQVSC